MIIAIDGPAAAGKGTLARRLAEKFNFAYLDTGALYRAVALTLLQAGEDPADEVAAARVSADFDLSIIGDRSLRSEATGGAASIVAAMPKVRDNLLKLQRNYASSPPENKEGVVLDGRDTGTVVCPKADLKLYVTATAEVRARRRVEELASRGHPADYATILADVKARDERDMNRAQAPLKPAADALLLDTTLLDIDAVFLRAVQIVEARAKAD